MVINFDWVGFVLVVRLRRFSIVFFIVFRNYKKNLLGVNFICVMFLEEERNNFFLIF